jgi:DNA-binding NarL/FixJ family response regulator
MRILFIEDHPRKKEQVIVFLNEIINNPIVETRESYNSGLRELISKSQEYDVLLLDMSMPNYDITNEDNGGDWLPFAGRLIMKNMYLREIATKVIVITMHGSFDDGTKIAELDNELKEEFPDNYIGYVYYAQTNIDWKAQLESLIKSLGS